MAAAEEVRSQYLDLCMEQNIEIRDEILKALIALPKDGSLSQTDELHVDLAGNMRSANHRRLDDDDVEMICGLLSKSEALASLDLRYNNFTDDGATAVAKVLEESTSIRKLNLMCNEITDEGAEKIAAALRENTSLTCLKMNGNKCGKRGGVHFARALEVNMKLQELDLGDTDLETESVIALATALRQNKHLRALNVNRPILFSCQEETTVHLSRMLKVNVSLRELHLSKSNVRDFGVERLCEGLADNRTLVYLNLSCNRISRDGAKCLAEFLMKNTPLEILDLGYNRIENDGAQHLSAALAVDNNTLKVLSIVFNCINGRGLVQVASIMKTNSTLSNIYIRGNNLEECVCDAFRSLIDGELLLLKNTDVKPYEVDGRNYLSELSHGLKRFYYWTPSHGADVVIAAEEEEERIV